MGCRWAELGWSNAELWWAGAPLAHQQDPGVLTTPFPKVAEGPCGQNCRGERCCYRALGLGLALTRQWHGCGLNLRP